MDVDTGKSNVSHRGAVQTQPNDKLQIRGSVSVQRLLAVNAKAGEERPAFQIVARRNTLEAPKSFESANQSG